MLWSSGNNERGVKSVAEENLLYYGDNLDVLRRHVADGSVDLVYLDPPFNSAQDYNVLFKERNGTEPAAQIRAFEDTWRRDQAAAQIRAFEDTWRWDQAAARAYQEIVEGGGKAAQAMIAFHSCLGANDMLAYLAMMAPRGIAAGVERDGEHLAALRPNGRPLSQDSYGRGVWRRKLC
jgi:hypothetical protein